MKNAVLKINDEFLEVGTRTVDNQNRLTIGKLIKTSKVRLYKNKRGQVLMQPITDIPNSELWLYRNEESLKAVQNGLKDAAEGKISKIDIDNFLSMLVLLMPFIQTV